MLDWGEKKRPKPGKRSRAMLQSIPVSVTREPDPPDQPDARLHGRWLIGARTVWLAVALFTLVVFIASIPVYFAQLQTLCAGTGDGPGVVARAAAGRRAGDDAARACLVVAAPVVTAHKATAGTHDSQPSRRLSHTAIRLSPVEACPDEVEQRPLTENWPQQQQATHLGRSL